VPEEKEEIPPGYALVGPKKTMGANMQLPRFDRQESMFRQGRSFQPAPSAGLGQLRLRMPVQGGVFDRQQFVGQVQSMPTLAPRVALSQAHRPDPGWDKTEMAPPAGQGVRRRPAMRIAWGRLKKMDAQQLADLLAQVLDRMKAKGIPPGMVEKIQARLAAFSASAPATETVEITEPEVQQMDAEILALEEAEAKDDATPWIIATGAAIGLGLLFSWLSD
jgi:hypothetical protein